MADRVDRSHADAAYRRHRSLRLKSNYARDELPMLVVVGLAQADDEEDVLRVDVLVLAFRIADKLGAPCEIRDWEVVCRARMREPCSDLRSLRPNSFRPTEMLSTDHGKR